VGVGGVVVIRLDIEIWVIGNGGTKKGVGGWENSYGGCWVLWPLCMFWRVSLVVEGSCVRDCRG
jgi:hypothetical protein